jgi:NADPH-dependent 7-cyano-7-deazaguanine reductase QueF-like protein
MYIYTTVYENFVNNTYANGVYGNLSTFLKENKNKIQNMKSTTQNIPLKKCIIQSSYNTALGSNNTVSLKNIVNIIRVGCRFIDFELFYIPHTHTTVVAVSKTKDSTDIYSLNTLSFNDVCRVISKNAFTLPCLNNNDPLFIHLRVKSMDNKILHSIAMTLDKYFSDYIITNININGDTLLKVLLGKIIIIFDSNNIKNYTDLSLFPNCYNIDDMKKNNSIQHNICYNLSNYISIHTNTNQIQSITHSLLLKQVYTNINSDTYQLKIVLPDNSDNDNNVFRDVTVQYGIQFLPMKYYHFDYKIKSYLRFFSEYAILPLNDLLFFTL